MVGVLKRKPIYITILHSRRLIYSLALTPNAEILDMTEGSIRVNEISDSLRIKHRMKVKPSVTFLNSLSELHFMSSFKLQDEKIPTERLIKKKIYNLIELKDFESLLKLFMKLTSTSSQENSSWQAFITPTEMSFYLRCMIEFQVNLIKQYANQKYISGNSNELKKIAVNAKYFKDIIRRCYSNLIYSNPTEHIYHHSKRVNLYNSNHLTGYQLQKADYENLIYFELHNAKVDLASKWFQRFETQFTNAQESMTKNMWILKLQVYSGGLPYLWKINNMELSDFYHNPTKSKFKSEQSFISIFNDFLKHQSKDNNAYAIDTKFSETLIYSIGYSKNLEYLTKYIELTWGIGSNGKQISGFQIPSNNSVNFPTTEILKAIVVAYSYNGEFFRAMTYINGFQNLYLSDISSMDSKNLWENIFKWCDISTKYNEEKALGFFLKNSSLGRDFSKISLNEAQKNAEFDYEGFLQFIDELKNKRNNTFTKLWNLYNDSNSFFSLQIHKRYLNYLKDNLESPAQTEAKFYDLLTSLLKNYHLFHTSGSSFNRITSHRVNNIDESIYALYGEALKLLIDLKWNSVRLGQCKPLIEKWSIDQPMANSLMEWYNNEVIPNYREMVEKKREEFMILLRTEEKDSLLDLI